MSATDIQRSLRSLAPARSERSTAPSKAIERASGSSVRKILWASATRARNLSIMGTACVAALTLVGVGMHWFGLAAFGVGSLAYASLIGRDAVDDEFVGQLFAIGDRKSEGEPFALCENNEEVLNLCDVDENLRGAYSAVLARRSQLQELLRAGPSILQATLPEGNRICDSLLTKARRLVRRGEHLHAYLRETKLTALSNSACEAVLQVEKTNDLLAARTYRQVVTGRQSHMETHIEVEGLYDRVLAQLVLIETTLAGAVAKIVKITAADDEESTLTAMLVNEELELLMSDVAILETSMDEAIESRVDVLCARRPA